MTGGLLVGGDWIGVDLPGDVLTLTIDGGGERWTLDGKPLHGGDGVELLSEGERRWCGPCDGEGWRAGDGGRVRCPDCGGRGYLFRPVWIPVRFEYRNGKGEAYLYPRLPGGGGELRHGLTVRPGDGLRARQRVAPW